MKRLPAFLAALVLLALAGCLGREQSPSGDVLPEQKMIDFLVDMHTLDAMLHVEKDLLEDKHDKSLSHYPSLLDKYGISRAQADSSVAYYAHRPKQFARMYGEVIRILEERQKDLSPNDSTD